MQAISSNFEDRPYSWGMAGGRPTTREGTEFGKRLSEARQRAGLTQMQLADRLGVSQKVVTYWERESVGLKADQLIALSDALAISVDELLGRGASAKQRGGPVGRARRVLMRSARFPALNSARFSMSSRRWWPSTPTVARNFFSLAVHPSPDGAAGARAPRPRGRVSSLSTIGSYWPWALRERAASAKIDRWVSARRCGETRRYGVLTGGP